MVVLLLCKALVFFLRCLLRLLIIVWSWSAKCSAFFSWLIFLYFNFIWNSSALFLQCCLTFNLWFQLSYFLLLLLLLLLVLLNALYLKLFFVAVIHSNPLFRSFFFSGEGRISVQFFCLVSSLTNTKIGTPLFVPNTLSLEFLF